MVKAVLTQNIFGPSVGAISTISSQGTTERTDNPWILMISGDAFFVVNEGGKYILYKSMYL